VRRAWAARRHRHRRDEYFVASDVPALLDHTRDLFFLGDGILPCSPRTAYASPISTATRWSAKAQVSLDPIMAEKGGFKHFMLKEIYEQPRTVPITTLGRVSQDTGHVSSTKCTSAKPEFKALKKINIAACGTVWHPDWRANS